MSHWDFERAADDERDAAPPGAAYPPHLTGGAWDGARPAGGWPDVGRYSGAGGYSGGGYPDDGYPGAGEEWADDETATAYPITYERDDFAAAGGSATASGGRSFRATGPQPAAGPHPPWETWRPAPATPTAEGNATVALDRPGSGAGAGTGFGTGAGSGFGGRGDAGWTGRDLGLQDGGHDAAGDWSGGRRGSRRWLIVAGVVVAGAAAGAAAVLLPGGHSAAQGQGAGGFTAPTTKPSQAAPAAPSASSSGAGPLTMTQAKSVLASYTAANNSANAQRNGTALATVESGSSYAIDAGLYREQSAAGMAPFPAFSPVQATYYIPRGEAAGAPRWFVVRVSNAFNSDRGKVTSQEYLLFTQPAGGGAWQDTIEPYLLSGATAPQVAVAADGMATAVAANSAAVTVAPGQLPAATAASLDGAGAPGQTVANPGDLADRADQRLWQGKVAGGTVTDKHTAAAGASGQEYALLTTSGGALVFYTDAAQVTITPPAGSLLHLTVPGFYSPAQGLTRAGVTYLEQFAAYDPPAGGGAPNVIADYSGITGKA